MIDRGVSSLKFFGSVGPGHVLADLVATLMGLCDGWKARNSVSGSAWVG